MNEFSLLCRVLGSLFYRQPNDAILEPLWAMIHSGKLQQQWPLKQDELLKHWSNVESMQTLIDDYNQLFVEPQLVSPFASDWHNLSEVEYRTYLTERGMTFADKPADHFGQLLLGASWIEDHSEEDETAAQIMFFERYLLPWYDIFLTKVNENAKTQFYKALAIITREAILAMYEELSLNTPLVRNKV